MSNVPVTITRYEMTRRLLVLRQGAQRVKDLMQRWSGDETHQQDVMMDALNEIAHELLPASAADGGNGK